MQRRYRHGSRSSKATSPTRPTTAESAGRSSTCSGRPWAWRLCLAKVAIQLSFSLTTTPVLRAAVRERNSVAPPAVISPPCGLGGARYHIAAVGKSSTLRLSHPVQPVRAFLQVRLGFGCRCLFALLTHISRWHVDQVWTKVERT